MLDRLLDGLFGDFVEQHAMDLAVEPCRAGRRYARRSPRLRDQGRWRDRYFFCSWRRLLDPFDDFGLARDDMIFGLEAMLDIDAELAFGQIDDMADRRRYLDSPTRDSA